MAVNMTIELLRDLLSGAGQDVIVDFCQVTPKRGRRHSSTVEYRISVEGRTSRGSHTTHWKRSLICKSLPVAVARCNASLVDSLFCNELAVHTKALPALLAFQASRSAHVTCPFRAASACYSGRSDLLALEDLTERGFKMADSEAGLDHAQCAAVLRELARLHALSLGMKRLRPQRFDAVVASAVHETVYAPEHEGWFRNYYYDTGSHVLSGVREALSTEDGSDKTYLERFESFVDSGTYFGRVVSLVAAMAPIRVLCHGDCRPNNIMFRCSDEGNILEVCMIGFQMSRFASPALDLATLLYCSTSHELRASRLKQMLEEYHAILSTQLQQLLGGTTPNSDLPDDELLSNPNKLWEILLEDFHRCGRFGLAVALDAMSDRDRALDLNTTAPAFISDVDDDEGAQRILVANNSTTCIASVSYCRKVAEVVRELVDNGDL